MERESRVIHTEQSGIENVLITEEILRRSGLVSIEYLPYEVGRELIAVDSVQADLLTKVKLLGYRFWYQDRRFDLIKDYLPEGMFRLENLDEVMNDRNGLGYLYEKIAEIGDLTDDIMPADLKDVNRYALIFDRVQKYFAIYPDEEFVANQAERIQRETSDQNRDKKLEEPNVLAIEWLKNKGYYLKEISGILNIPERKIEFILRGLYLQGRCSPQPEHSERTKRFIELAQEVEKLRKKGLTVREISQKLNVGESRVQDAARVLISIGRISVIGKDESRERRYKTKQNRMKVRKALRSYLQERAGEQISFSTLAGLAGVKVSKETISRWYYEIAMEEEVPPVKDDARERAIEILLEIGRSTREQINLLDLSRKRKIAYKTFLRAYDDIRHIPDAPILRIAAAERKKIEFADALGEFLITNPGDFFSIRNYCKRIGLNYTTGIKWYWEYAKLKSVPPIRRHGVKSE